MKKILQSAQAQAVIAWIAARYALLVARTVRWQVEGEAGFLAASAAAPLIVVFWHETLPSMPVLWLNGKRRGMARPAVALASRHRDGQLIGKIVRQIGLGLVSGSSSRGGAAGLRNLLKALQAGQHVVLTPDGPRGPARSCAPGVAQLAGVSGNLVMPCGVRISRAKTLKSWDKMRLPLPFGRGALVCGEPIAVSRDGWQDGLPRITAAMNAAMDRAAALL